jgi:hypothetical protein
MDTKLKCQKHRLKFLTVNAVRHFGSPYKCLYGAPFIDVDSELKYQPTIHSMKIIVSISAYL